MERATDCATPSVLELYLEEGTPSVHAVAGAISGDIATEIERRSLSYSRNVTRYREYGMPWLVHCITRLPKGMEDGQRLNILTFLSCIGMIQIVDYVSFKDLPTLIKEMGMSQAELQRLRIQSRFLLPKVKGLSVWRLHDSIPYRMGPPPPPPKSVHVFHEREEKEETLKEDMDVQIADVNEVRPDMSRGLYVAANRYRRWTKDEEGMVDISVAQSTSYKRYLEMCKEKMIPARSRKSFERKYDKMTGKR